MSLYVYWRLRSDSIFRRSTAGLLAIDPLLLHHLSSVATGTGNVATHEVVVLLCEAEGVGRRAVV